jgi:hypothetical protein
MTYFEHLIQYSANHAVITVVERNSLEELTIMTYSIDNHIWDLVSDRIYWITTGIRDATDIQISDQSA